MPLPSSYTESQLRDYMLHVTGNVGVALGLASADFAEAVNDALVVYGATDIATATDIPRLRAAARVAAWERALALCAGRVDFGADGANFRQSQLMDQARAALSEARADAATYGVGWAGYAVESADVNYNDDPYPLV